MGIQNALFTGVSGMTTYSNVISIIGNNIANVNTPGFKESRGNFSDILSQSSGSSGNLQIGRGVRMNKVDQLFTQGRKAGFGHQSHVVVWQRQRQLAIDSGHNRHAREQLAAVLHEQHLHT